MEIFFNKSWWCYPGVRICQKLPNFSALNCCIVLLVNMSQSIVFFFLKKKLFLKKGNSQREEDYFVLSEIMYYMVLESLSDLSQVAV